MQIADGENVTIKRKAGLPPSRSTWLENACIEAASTPAAMLGSVRSEEKGGVITEAFA
jgi:hypothetical protein